MATHSSILAWRIPWTEEPGRLTSGHKESDTIEVIYHIHPHKKKTLPCKDPRSYLVQIERSPKLAVISLTQGFPDGSVVKNPPANAGDTRVNPWVGKIP